MKKNELKGEIRDFFTIKKTAQWRAIWSKSPTDEVHHILSEFKDLFWGKVCRDFGKKN